MAHRPVTNAPSQRGVPRDPWRTCLDLNQCGDALFGHEFTLGIPCPRPGCRRRAAADRPRCRSRLIRQSCHAAGVARIIVFVQPFSKTKCGRWVISTTRSQAEVRSQNRRAGRCPYDMISQRKWRPGGCSRPIAARRAAGLGGPVSVASLTEWRDRSLAGAASAVNELEHDDRDDEIAPRSPGGRIYSPAAELLFNLGAGLFDCPPCLRTR
jgi:hypothetical protein